MDQFTPLLGNTLSAPIPVPATDGRVHLAYELQLLNAIGSAATVERIDVLGDGESLLTLEGDDLGTWFKPFGSPFGQRELAGGQGALVWLDVVVDTLDAVPIQLTHEVTVTFAEPNPPIVLERMTETIAVVDVLEQPAIVIGPPLEGRGWLDGNSCCEITAHRTAVNAINGSLHAPERFAIDYVRLEADGLFLHGPADELASYRYYGANILAVGDGPVVAMRWDLPEQPPGKDPTGLTLDEYGGNHIVQDLGDGHYAFYAHLQPDNPMGVEVGQQLRRGDVIGLLGNTGNTDSPHLHFHIMDTPSPLGSNGLPFMFDTFDLAGRITSQAEMIAKLPTGGPFPIDTSGAGPRTDQSPLVLDIMDYPAR